MARRPRHVDGDAAPWCWQDSDGEPAPPIVLDKSSSDAAAGLVLRKQKTKTAKKSDSSMKIKF